MKLAVRILKNNIPNFITMTALLCGMFSVYLSVHRNVITQVVDMVPSQLSLYAEFLAVFFLLFAVILDFLDGAAARALNAESKLGKHLDTMADFLNFGIAPVFVTLNAPFYVAHIIGFNAYDYERYIHISSIANADKTIIPLIGQIIFAIHYLISALLKRFNELATFIRVICDNNLIFLYPAFISWRLARFSSSNSNPTRFFEGIPAPAAAVLLVCIFYITMQIVPYKPFDANPDLHLNFELYTDFENLRLISKIFAALMYLFFLYAIVSKIKTPSLKSLSISKIFFCFCMLFMVFVVFSFFTAITFLCFAYFAFILLRRVVIQFINFSAKCYGRMLKVYK